MNKNASSISLYQELVATVEEYLGPASERFVDRQIRSHLHKEPAKITRADLQKLIEWMRIAASFLTNDKEVVEALTKRLWQLAPAHTPKR